MNQIDPWIIDSIAGDTVGLPRYVYDPTACARADSLAALRADSLATAAALEPAVKPRGSGDGLAGSPLPPTPTDAGWLMALLVALPVLLAIEAATVGRVLRRYVSDLWSTRRRPNVFDSDEAPSAGSVPVGIALALQYVLYAGVALYYGAVDHPSSAAGVAASCAIVGIYYLFLLAGYSLVGYVFGDGSQRRRWVAGFVASRALLGLSLIVPVIAMMQFLQWRSVFLAIALSLYVLARLIFIAKGIRIFYHKIGSLLYFILYLCTLEIIPISAVALIAARILPAIA